MGTNDPSNYYEFCLNPNNQFIGSYILNPSTNEIETIYTNYTYFPGITHGTTELKHENKWRASLDLPLSMFNEGIKVFPLIFRVNIYRLIMMKVYFRIIFE